MFEKDFYPIIVLPIVQAQNGCIHLLCQDHITEIDSRQTDIVWSILNECNGYYNIEEISTRTKLQLKTVTSLLLQLLKIGAIIDSRKQYLHFHRMSNYPTNYNCKLNKKEIAEYTKSSRYIVKSGEKLTYKIQESVLKDILTERHSCRNFSDKLLTLDDIGSICHYGYSIQNKYVPSGGALYPLKIYMLIEKEQINLPKGYYEYDPETNQLICFSNSVDDERIKYCFNSENLPYGSSIQMIIAADLSRQTYKYSNRGYRLTLLEAGHVAENVCIYCTEKKIGSCEFGGVLDEALRIELGMSDEIYPLLAIAIGYENSNKKVPFDEEIFLEENHLKSPNYGAKNFDDNCTFWGAYAQYGNTVDEIAGATSTSYVHAIFKANVEAYERKLSGNARVDFTGTASDLAVKKKKWLNPNEIVPLTKEQHLKSNTSIFSENLDIQWTKGYSYKLNSDIYIPTDLVYYGHKHFKNTIYYSCSSGVAAYTDIQTAQEKALIELIERDAIMRNWFSKESPSKLGTNILSTHVNNIITYWGEKGRKVYILNLPSKYATVILVAIVSDMYPCFVCGAAATLDRVENSLCNTIHKALQEAEYCLYSCLDNPDYATIDPQKVVSPKDHGKLYHTNQYIKSLEWLWSGDVVNTLPMRNTIYNFDDLAKKLELCKVLLTDEDTKVSVVRVLSPKLIPISFGYYNVHYMHREIVNCKQNLDLPHYFA